MSFHATESDRLSNVPGCAGGTLYVHQLDAAALTGSGDGTKAALQEPQGISTTRGSSDAGAAPAVHSLHPLQFGDGWALLSNAGTGGIILFSQADTSLAPVWSDMVRC